MLLQKLYVHELVSWVMLKYSFNLRYNYIKDCMGIYYWKAQQRWWNSYPFENWKL